MNHGRLRLISLNGSPRAVSRTDLLVRRLGAALASALDADWRHYPVSDIGPTLLPALTRDRVDAAGETILRSIEAADVLVVGTPVYRASLSGALKHVFDLIDYRSLRGRIAVLAATGGNRHHGLVTEHQLRPLMSFFGTITVPTAIYAEETDFDGPSIGNPDILARIEAATNEVVRLLAGSRVAQTSTARQGELVP